MELKRFFKSKRTKALALGVFGWLADKILGTNVLSYVWDFIIDISINVYKFFTSIYEVQLWYLFFLPIAAGCIVFFVIRFIILRNEKLDEIEQKQQRYSFLNYREDKFGKLVYRWSYVLNLENKYSPYNITALCPDCKCILVAHECPNCDVSYYGCRKSNDDIESLIIYNIEQKYRKKEN